MMIFFLKSVIQVFKGGLFRSATEHKEQIRYFSQQVLIEHERLCTFFFLQY